MPVVPAFWDDSPHVLLQPASVNNQGLVVHKNSARGSMISNTIPFCSHIGWVAFPKLSYKIKSSIIVSMSSLAGDFLLHPLKSCVPLSLPEEISPHRCGPQQPPSPGSPCVSTGALLYPQPCSLFITISLILWRDFALYMFPIPTMLCKDQAVNTYLLLVREPYTPPALFCPVWAGNSRGCV